MENNQDIYLLYKFSNMSDNKEGHGSKYQVIYLFDNDGIFEFEDMKKLIAAEVDIPRALSFTTKDELLQFAYALVNSSEHERIYLLANNDFNIGVESCHDLKDLNEIFRRYGTELMAEQGKSKSLFGKLF